MPHQATAGDPDQPSTKQEVMITMATDQSENHPVEHPVDQWINGRLSTTGLLDKVLSIFGLGSSAPTQDDPDAW